VSSVNELYNKISVKINSDGLLKRQVESSLVRTVSDAFIQMMSSDQGYCFSFIIKQKNFNTLLSLLDLTEQDLKLAYKKDWGPGAARNHMHSDSYYQLYLLMLYYGIKEKDEKIVNNCMICILIKLWNGRKKKYIPFCNKDIMAYVVNYMTSKKHSINRFSNPLELIQNYFTPTLLQKYQNNVKTKGAMGLKELFEAAFTRVRQLFVYNPITDIKTGKRISTGGIHPLYHKAHKDGMSIKNAHVFHDEDNPASFADYISTSELDKIISTTVKSIVNNTRPNYSQMFINNLYKDYGVKTNTITHILNSLHDLKYKDKLQDLYSIILQQTGISSKDDICNAKFTSLVQKKIIASKNNKTSQQLKTSIHELLDEVMLDYLKVKPLSSHSSNHLIQLHKLIIRALIYNLRSAICK
jgi:hypothetical protein